MQPRTSLGRLILPLTAVALVWTSNVQAANRVYPPATVILSVPVAQCDAPSSKLWSENAARFTDGDWKLVGAPQTRWLVQLDADRAAALGLPMSAVRELFEETVAAAKGDAGDIDHVLFTKTIRGAKGAEVPLRTVATFERGRTWSRRPTIDGVPVVAAIHADEISTLAIPAAGLALAEACHVSLDQVRVTTLWDVMTTWRIAYHTTETNPERSWSHGQALEGGIASARGEGLTVGWHGEHGGAIWGFSTDRGVPGMAPRRSLSADHTHVVLQRVQKEHFWTKPFLAVIRMMGPAEDRLTLWKLANTVTAEADASVNIAMAQAEDGVVFYPNEKRLAQSKLTADDVRFALHGAKLHTADGALVDVRIQHAGAPAATRITTARHKTVQVSELGELRDGPRVTTVTTGDGHALLYLTVPSDAVMAVAKVLATLPLPKGVVSSSINWNVLTPEEGDAILDWWQDR